MNRVKESLHVPWVLTGSAAMKLYGNKYGVATRTPHNINIIVRPHNLNEAYNTLFLLSNKTHPRNTSREKSKNRYNLSPFDLLKAGTNLAPRINSWVVVNGYPVVSLENLIKYKPRPENLKTNQKNKSSKNISTLRTILSKKKSQNVRTNKFTKPVRKTPVHVNNFSTPPSTPRA